MFDFLFASLNVPSTSYKAKRRPSLQPPDPMVDISYMYTIMVKREHICAGYFVTCKSHREAMEKQELVFPKLYTEDGFMAFVGNPNRTIALPLHRKIKNFILYGIPPRYRSKMWPILVGVDRKASNLSLYSELFTRKKDEDTVSQIKLDVFRTVPAVEDPVFIDRLLRVLTAYSIRNPKLGYCQSMNFLAGTLLLFMDEECAFWMLVYIVEEMLQSYYIPSMAGFHVDANVFEWLVSDNLPELHKHFRKLQLSCKILTSPWFLCLYVNDFPTETSFLVWDNIMLEGVIVMFEVGLAILHMLQPELLQFDCQVELMQHIRKRTLEIHDPKVLLKHWPRLDKIRTLSVRRKMRQKAEEEAMKKLISKQLGELEAHTHFESKDLMTLWSQFASIISDLPENGEPHYNKIDPDSETFVFDKVRFAQFIGGTFGEWWADEELVSRLFALTDVNKDGIVDFCDLVKLLSVMCRGTQKEVVTFNFQLFDAKAKGWVDSFDLSRMLQSIYGMFKSDHLFQKQLHKIVDDIFKKHAGALSIDNFETFISMQSEILSKFKRRNPTVAYSAKQTYYYWMFENERPFRNSELIVFAMDRKAPTKQSQVPLPVVFVK